MRRATLADVDLIKKILLESFKNDPPVNWLQEKSKNKFKLNVLIDYVVHQKIQRSVQPTGSHRPPGRPAHLGIEASLDILIQRTGAAGNY